MKGARDKAVEANQNYHRALLHIGSKADWPACVSKDLIRRRLQIIFADEVPGRSFCISEDAASTVFVMIYCGAVEGSDLWISLRHVTSMTTQQSELVDARSRAFYVRKAMIPRWPIYGDRWYKACKYQSIRNETIRQGLMRNAAVMERPGICASADLPKFALCRDFGGLFDPTLTEGEFLIAAKACRFALLR